MTSDTSVNTFPSFISKSSDNYELVFLKITDVVEQLFPDNKELISKYRRSSPAVFDDSEILTLLFSKTEIDRINSFKMMKKQIEWISGRICIKHLFNTFAGLAPKSIVLQQEKEGAPFLPEKPSHIFSITHSGEYAGAVLVKEPGTMIGLDLEDMRRDSIDAITGIAFTEKERKAAKTKEAIFTIWTIKEAYLKYIRRGFHEALKSVEYLNNTLYHNDIAQKLSVRTKLLDKNHIYTIIH